MKAQGLERGWEMGTEVMAEVPVIHLLAGQSRVLEYPQPGQIFRQGQTEIRIENRESGIKN